MQKSKGTDQIAGAEKKWRKKYKINSDNGSRRIDAIDKCHTSESRFMQIRLFVFHFFLSRISHVLHVVVTAIIRIAFFLSCERHRAFVEEAKMCIKFQ